MNTFKEENVENPYRYGALVGNWVEERYGKELASRPEPNPNFLTSSQAFHSKRSTVHYSDPKPEEPEFNPTKVSQSGVDRHLFFGHGPNQDEFEARELRTSYELSMLKKIPAHISIDSHFAPPPLSEKTELYIPPQTNPGRKPKAYDEFTKRCDATFNKVGFRK
jgi:hypothetical protein